MVLMKSAMAELGSSAVDFTLPAADGKEYALASFKDAKALVIIVMCNHCPYVKAVFGRLIDIQTDYKDKGVALIGINPNDADNYPEDSLENMKKVVREKGINFVYLRDESQEISRKYGAVCTPDIYLYGPDRKLFYRGRIDDNWQNESAVTTHDLRAAIDRLLAGQQAPQPQHPSMGCSIKWK